MLFIFTKQGDNQRHLLYYLIGLLLFLFSGLRYAGVDYFNYNDIFDKTANLWDLSLDNFYSVHGEFGFYIINVIIKSFDMPFEMLMIIIAFINIYLLVRNSQKYSMVPLMSILLYYNRFYIDRNLGQIRAAVACMIVVYALQYISDKNFKKYFFLVLAACMFHKLSLMAIVLYFVGNYELKNVSIIASMTICAIIGAVIPIDDSVGLLLVYFSDMRFADYLGDTEYYMKDLGVFYPVTIMQVIIVIIYLSMRDKLKKIMPYNNLMLNMYLLSTLWLLLTHKFGIYAGRLATLFGTAEIFLLAAMPYWFENKIYRYRCIAFLSMISFTFLLIKISDIDRCPEYQSILELII